jgi:peptidoglycan hydrolase CwlO-like protein
MGKVALSWMKRIDPNAAVAALATGVVIWLLTTFATIELVNSKHADAIEHTDTNFRQTQATLQEIKETVKRIDDRVWKLTERKR